MIAELFSLFVIYSFIGWLGESIFSNIKQKRIVNRGVLNGPLCCMYGTTMVVITIVFPEVKNRYVFLFIGSTIIFGLAQWIGGHILEKIYRRKWWDFSKHKFNFDGYVSLLSATAGGLACSIALLFVNPLLIAVIHLIPRAILIIILWCIFGILVVDAIWSYSVILALPQKLPKTEKINSRLTKISASLDKWVMNHVTKRYRKAYPTTLVEQEKEEKKNVFAYGCSFYKLFLLFVIGAFLGDIVETIFCRLSMGEWMSRSSVVWGPFSVVWGLAISLATWMLYNYRQKSDGFLFIVGTFVGGTYEYICSVFTEIAFGQVFWDYKKIPFNLGGRINLLFCFFWGIAAVVWLKKLYPIVSKWIECIPVKIGKSITWILIIFMSINMVVSASALARSDARTNGKEASNLYEKWLDDNYNDEVLKRIYPNSKKR